MSNKKGAINIIFAVRESGTVGVRTDYNGLRYVRFTKLASGGIGVCVDGNSQISRVSHDVFVNMAKNLEGHIIGMHP